MAMTPREEKFLELTDAHANLLAMAEEQMGFSTSEESTLGIQVGTPIWNTTGSRIFGGAMQFEYDKGTGTITPLKNIFGSLDIRGDSTIHGELATTDGTEINAYFSSVAVMLSNLESTRQVVLSADGTILATWDGTVFDINAQSKQATFGSPEGNILIDVSDLDNPNIYFSNSDGLQHSSLEFILHLGLCIDGVKISTQSITGGGSNVVGEYTVGTGADSLRDLFGWADTEVPIEGESYFIRTYAREGSPDLINQEAFGHNTVGSIYTRYTNDGGLNWEPWVEIASHVPNVSNLSYQDTIGGGSNVINKAVVDANLARDLFTECNGNVPTSGWYHVRTTKASDDSNVLHQLAFGHDGISSGIYGRHSTDGGATWTAWVDVSTPAGTVSDYAGTTAPVGWLICDGATLNSSANPEFANLYSVIGTTFGGTSESDFLIPNLIGNMTLGSGGSYPIGGSGGAATVNLSLEEMPNHEHSYTYKTWSDHNSSEPDGSSGDINDNTGTTSGASGHTLPVTVDPVNRASSAPHNNMPPYVALLKIIKY